MYGSSDVDEVKQRANIIDVVSRYVALTRRGAAWKGLCPFHSEKTPSFTVNPDTGRWHCFGACGEGGDVIKFVMKIENLPFREALERLAEQYNVTLAYAGAQNAARTQEARSQKDRIHHACEVAARFYQETLSRASDAGDYLAGRGYGHEILTAFRVGYAGPDGSALVRYLSRSDVDPADAIDAGVIVTSDFGGGYRDKFVDRIIFPIVDVNERIIAFGGRLMEASETRPKYLNSAETPVFVKSKQLYGLWRARKAIAAASEAIVVEGYLDVIACHQAGFENVVATLGTALTDEHASILNRHASRVILAFDADSAGLKAAQKASRTFGALSIDTRILALPEGEDPDSLLKAGREVELRNAISAALPVTEFYLRKLVARGTAYGVADADRDALFRTEALPLLRETKSVMERERYIRLSAPLHPHFAAGSAYAEEQIRQEIEGRVTQPASFGTGASSGQWDRSRRGGSWGRPRPQEAPQPVVPPPSSLRTAHDAVFRALVSGTDEMRAIVIENVRASDFEEPLSGIYCDIVAGANVVDALESRLAEHPELGMMLAHLTVEPESHATPITETGLRYAIAYLVQMRVARLEKDLKIRMEAGDLSAAAEYHNLVRQRPKQPGDLAAQGALNQGSD